MSDEQEKKQRPVTEIQQEYTQMCAKLGHLTYNSHCLKKDIDLVKSALETLNLEAAAASVREAKEKEAQIAKESQKEQPLLNNVVELTK